MESNRESSKQAVHPPGKGPLASLARGFALPFEGFRLLIRERSLWALSTVPIALTVGLLGIAMGLLFEYSGALWDFIEGFWPVFKAHAWYAWIWVAPLRVFFWSLSGALFLLSIAAGAAVSVLLASLLSSPFLDVLTRRVETLVAGGIQEEGGTGMVGGVKETGRSMAAEAGRIGFLLVIWVVLTGLGLLIPGAQLITGPLMLATTILFMPLQFSGSILDRRQLPFSIRRRWISANWPVMVGFGLAAFIVCFVPGMNLLVLPALVSAGTLLVLEVPPTESR
ncbi:EI24 domain-containing protein [Myxococcota bacterium]|nr:EI24 domain-containing protein [Myxococcota bacterium]